MIRMLSTIIAVLVLAGSAFGQVTVLENPSKQTSFVEAYTKLEVGQSVTWFITPEPDKQVEYDNIVYFNGPAGTYKVTALVLTVKDNKVISKKTSVNVVIGTPKPIPPVPDPVPVPTDPFTQAIQEAFTAEIAADKAVSASKLAAVYRMAAKNTVATATTTGELFDTMKTASRTLLPDTALPGVRKVIGARLNSAFGTSTTLDATSRAKLVTEFNAIADALSSAK